MRKKFLFFITVVFISSLNLFAQKPNKNSENFEINNLFSDKTVKTTFGKISESNGIIRYIYRENFKVTKNTPEEMAFEYLNSKKALFGISDPEKELSIKKISQSPGGIHILLGSNYKGIPVFASDITLTINKNKIVSFAASNYRNNLSVDNVNPALAPEDAIAAARRYLNASGRLLAEQKAELMIFQSADGKADLAYRVQIPIDKPMGDWEIFIDANSGGVIHVKDRMIYRGGRDNSKATGQGLVWKPDPLTTAGVYYGDPYLDNNDGDSDPINNQRLTAQLNEITFDGSVYKLEGPYVKLSDMETPNDNFPELTDPNGFNFTRSQQEFEDVMVYFHVDKSYRHLMALGFNIPSLLQFKADPHGLDGDDNSHFVPSGNYCAWGEGGVDDAEDAAVIWHEYGHAIQDNITGGMTYTGETMSLQEGSSDYWAVSHERSISEHGWGQVFIWDAGNTSASDASGTFWPGRHADLDWVYPDDYVSGHDGGQIWSSALMKIWEDLGRDITDQLFIEAHYIWGTGPGLQDAAQAFIQADIDLYGGEHLSSIVYWFDNRGLVNASDFLPQIIHTPLTDTEDLIGPYTVNCTLVAAVNPLDPDQLKVVYGKDAAPDTEILLQPVTGKSGDYFAEIPNDGTPGTFNYYITIGDSGGTTVYDPPNAPSEYHSFIAGPDTELPVINHNPLNDYALIRWPASVTATVTDNLGIDSVWVAYSINGGAIAGEFPLANTSGDLYSGSFPSVSVSIGDLVEYKIVALDASASANISVLPTSGFYSFNIIDTRGVVLVLDDDALAKLPITDEKGVTYRDKESFSKSAASINDYLNAIGFTSVTEAFSASNSADWTNYNFIVVSCGLNDSPLADAAQRANLTSYVQSGGKVLIEGGELGWDFGYYDTDIPFRESVLHITGWEADNSAGDLSLLDGAHAIALTPNLLPSNIGFTDQTSWYDKDACALTSDAYAVFDWTGNSGDGGVIVHDGELNGSAVPSTVYFSFNLLSITNETDWHNLLENTAEYLMSAGGDVPVELTSFSVNVVDDIVYLIWETATESNNLGFAVERKAEDSFEQVGFQKGAGNSTSKTGYSFTDRISKAGKYTYRLKQVDFDGTYAYSEEAEAVVGLPSKFALYQNYPNPFNPSTVIKFDLPKDEFVRLNVYNIIGEKIAALVNNKMDAGRYEVKFNASSLASGIYIYRINAGKFNSVMKMLLIK